MNCALLMAFIAESHKMHGEWRVNLGNVVGAYRCWGVTL
jgi:hypothetical protein